MRHGCATMLICGVTAWGAFGQQPADPGAAAPLPPAPAPAADPAAAAPADVLIGGAVRPQFIDVAWAPDGKKEKAVVLGLSTSPASEAIREQLKLSRGLGLVVEAVEKDGPAGAAGVKRHDVLEKLDDQLLVNPQQLSTLVRSKKAGDEVALTVVRQGERQTVKAKLVEKEVAAGGGGGIGWQFVERPAEMRFVNQDVVVADAFVPNGGVAVGGAMPTKMLMRDVNGRQTTQWSDAEHDITLDRENGRSTRLKAVESKSGRVVFEGAIETDEQRKAIPPEVLKKVESAEATPAGPVNLTRMKIANMGGMGGGGPGMMGGGGARGRVVQWQDDNAILMMRTLGKTPTYLLALSKKDGRVIYDGPVQTEEQRKGVPAEIGEQFEMLVKQPNLAKEFGAPEGGL